MNPQLEALQQVINGVHALMVVLRDPQQVAVVSQCLKALTGLQKEMMQPAQNGQQAMIQQLAGAQGGGPPQQGGPAYG